MTDNTHNFNNRYTFSTIPSREKYSWPNGSKLAVYFALNAAGQRRHVQAEGGQREQ